jgi:predicted dehydrogenase
MAADTTPLRIGIVGGGNWTRTVHLPNLQRVEGVVVTAISTRDAERRERAQTAYDRPIRFCDTADELIAAGDTDAVLVCTPNHTHESLSIAVLTAGKHLLCEKPAALTVEGVDRIGALCGDSVFQVDLELGYSDVVSAVRGLVHSGVIGRPRLLSCLLMRNWGAFRGWRGDPRQSGGMVLELGIHYLDLFNVVVGEVPSRVHAAGGHAAGAALPDYLGCQVCYPSGAIAQLGLTVLASARNEIRLHVVGDEARLDAEIIGGTLELWRRGASAPEDCSPLRPPDYRFDGFPGSLEALQGWVECIRTGAPPLAGLAAARAATAVSAAAEASLRSGNPEAVE